MKHIKLKDILCFASLVRIRSVILCFTIIATIAVNVVFGLSASIRANITQKFNHTQSFVHAKNHGHQVSCQVLSQASSEFDFNDLHILCSRCVHPYLSDFFIDYLGFFRSPALFFREKDHYSLINLIFHIFSFSSLRPPIFIK